MLQNHIKIAPYIKFVSDTMVHIIEYRGNETEKCQDTFTLWVPIVYTVATSNRCFGKSSISAQLHQKLNRSACWRVFCDN